MTEWCSAETLYAIEVYAKGDEMENEKSLQEDTINDDFKVHLNSLKEIYSQSILKEKHKLNEHIRHILQIHGNQDTKNIEKDLKENR
jgi:hypothetical protein